MKKTAVLSIYCPYGTWGITHIDIMYRGRVLYDFAGGKHQTGELLQRAMQWAKNQGFTDTRAVWQKTA